ncbi:alpha-galactosidase [Paenibacillus macquariensis subsp. defensor]|nr:alpha-galactosidase [Paenibacillus macquariensis subsp. defensor]
MICITEFGAKPNSGEDTVQAMQLAVDAISQLKGSVLLNFPKGRYDFYPEHAAKVPYYISNTASEVENADVVKTIGIFLREMNNVIVEGNGSLFVFHGKQTMIVLDRCENIEIRNVNTDYEQPTMAEMTVVAVGNNDMDINVHPTSRYEIDNGKLYWIGEGWRFHKGHMQQYDPLTNTTWRIGNLVETAIHVEQLAPFQLRLYYDSTPIIVAGSILQVRDGIRDQVGAFIHQSSNIKWNNVGMHYMHGLGIVCQSSSNLTFDKINMAPRPETGRTAAAFADFMHISGCSGKVAIYNSHFEGAHDDAINVHGTHLRIIDQPAPNQVLVRFMHGQSYGFDAFFPGDEIDFIRSSSLTAYASNTVKRAEFINARDRLLTLEQPIQGQIVMNDVIENATWTPEVEISNNYFARIPTRGILVSTRRKITIEDNVFERMPMSAILIANDAESWYESGMVRDVMIRSNQFIECGDRHNPVIYIAPENSEVSVEIPVHSNIHIESNSIQMKDAAVLSAKSTHHLSFNNNEISAASHYNKFETPIIQLTACIEVAIDVNRINGEGINKNILVQAMPVENITIMPEQEFVVCVK